MSNSKPIFFGPSQFAFTYSCPRCLWLRHRHNLKPPSGDFEGFNLVDNTLKVAMPRQRLHELGIPGKVRACGRKCVSRDVGTESTPAVIFGYTDAIVDLDDGGVAIVDFKAGHPKDDGAARYHAQLSSYAYALIYPEKDTPEEVTAAWLVYVYPDAQQFVEKSLCGSWAMEAVPVAIDLTFVEDRCAELIRTIEQPTPPARSENCNTCQHANRILEIARLVKEEAHV